MSIPLHSLLRILLIGQYRQEIDKLDRGAGVGARESGLELASRITQIQNSAPLNGAEIEGLGGPDKLIERYAGELARISERVTQDTGIGPFANWTELENLSKPVDLPGPAEAEGDFSSLAFDFSPADAELVNDMAHIERYRHSRYGK